MWITSHLVCLQGHQQSCRCTSHRQLWQEHCLNTNQTSFTAGFIGGSWETVPSRLLAMVTRDSFQGCHAALSSQRLIHSPPPSGSLRFCPFPVQTLQSPSRPASWKENIPYLSSALIMRHRSGFQTHARAQVWARAQHTVVNICTLGMGLIDFKAVQKQIFGCKRPFFTRLLLNEQNNCEINCIFSNLKEFFHIAVVNATLAGRIQVWFKDPFFLLNTGSRLPPRCISLPSKPLCSSLTFYSPAISSVSPWESSDMDKRSQGPEHLWLDDNLLEDEQQLCQVCFYLAVLPPVVGSCPHYSGWLQPLLSQKHCCAIFMLALHHFTVRGISSGFTQTEHSVCCIEPISVF